MIEFTLLSQILEANRSFLAGTPKLLDPNGDSFVVLTCIDSRLTGFLEPALGLPRHRAIVIRSAGNRISADTPDTLRSIAAALFVKNAREIIVMGHSDCGMSTFSAAEVADNFRKSGIARSAFGDQDLRTWFGAIGNIRENVLATVDFLRKSGIVPPAVKSHGLIFDTDKGTLEVVADGNNLHETPPALTLESQANVKIEIAAEKNEPAKSPKPAEKSPHPSPSAIRVEPASSRVVIGMPDEVAKPQAPPDSLLEAVSVLHGFFQSEKQNRALQKGLSDLRALWKQEKNPVHVYKELQRLVSAYKDRYPNLPGALLYLENIAKSGEIENFGFGELLKRIFG
jgi:carbonic anhydrase